MANSVVVVVSGEDKSGAVFDAIKKHLDETRDKAEETSTSLGQVGELLQNGLQMAGIAIGVREVISGFKEMISTSMELGVEIGHLHQQTGISTQNLSTLKYMSDSTGVSFESLTKGFKKLSTTIFEANTEGSKLARDTFSALGLSLDQVKAKGQDMYGILEMIADKFEQMPDGPQKSAIATQLFGRAGQDLIPILNEGANGIESFRSQAEALGLVLDEDGIKKMEELHRSVADMKGAWAGLGLEITSTFAPALEKAATATSELIAEWRAAPWNMTKATAGYMIGFWDPEYEEAQAKAALHKGAASNGPQKPPPPDDDDNSNSKDKSSKSKTHAHAVDLTGEQERAATAHRALMDALAKSDETRARSQAQTLLEINDEMHKEGLRSETEYLAQKGQLQETQFNAERAQLGQEQRAILDQIRTLEERRPKTAKERLETQAKLNQLEAQYLGVCDKVTELEERQSKAAREIENAMANAHIALPEGPAPDLGGIFGSSKPNVTLGKQPLFDPAQVQGEAEKFAHGVFDPLFNLGEKWDQQWKQIRQNMLRNLGQTMESQLFGVLFGDPQGRGGKGWNGMSWEGNTTNPRGGLQSNAGGLIGGLLGLFTHKGSGVASNGGLGSGAGTVPSAAASLMQMGNKSGASAGIQVVLNNNGAPLQVDQTQQQNDGGEGQVIQIMLKQLETNGPVAQGIMGMVGAL